jgi:hypothetical protein
MQVATRSIQAMVTVAAGPCDGEKRDPAHIHLRHSTHGVANPMPWVQGPSTHAGPTLSGGSRKPLIAALFLWCAHQPSGAAYSLSFLG